MPTDIRIEFPDHPVLLPFDPQVLRRFESAEQWPSVDEYNALAGIDSPLFADVPPGEVTREGGYENYVARHGCVPTRSRNWHDLFNFLAWVHFPETKAALHEVHIQEMAHDADPRNARTQRQNSATLFDEAGVIVASAESALLESLQRLEFKSVFWNQRASVESELRILVVGHALVDALRTPSPEPHSGFCGRGIFISLTKDEAALAPADLRRLVDARVALLLREGRLDQPFDPVPVLGIPGWHPEQDEGFYNNTHYFRARRQSDRRGNSAHTIG